MTAHPKPTTESTEQNPSYPLAAPVEALGQVWRNAANDLLTHHTETCAIWFAETMESMVPAYAPGGTNYWLQQMPAVWQTQWQHLAQSADASMTILARTQQQLLEWGAGALTAFSEQTAPASEDFQNRRVSATVIDFPDRRAAAHAIKRSAPHRKAIDPQVPVRRAR